MCFRWTLKPDKFDDLVQEGVIPGFLQVLRQLCVLCALCSLCSVFCALCSVLCALCSVLCALCSVLYLFSLFFLALLFFSAFCSLPGLLFLPLLFLSALPALLAVSAVPPPSACCFRIVLLPVSIAIRGEREASEAIDVPCDLLPRLHAASAHLSGQRTAFR